MAVRTQRQQARPLRLTKLRPQRQGEPRTASRVVHAQPKPPEIYSLGSVSEAILIFQDLIREAEHWNHANPSRTPRDCESIRIALNLARRAKRALILANQASMRLADFTGRIGVTV